MTQRVKIERGSGNVFSDIGFAPGEAENLLLRAQLMSRIRDAVRDSTQKEAGIACEWRPDRGKGSHGLLILGNGGRWCAIQRTN